MNLLDMVLPRGIGPSKDTQGTAQKTDAQSDLRMGIVTDVTTRGITVAVGAQTVSAAHIDSYAPAIGDAVALVAVQDSWLALGRVVGPGNPTDGSAAAAAAGPSLIGGGAVTGISNVSLASSAGPATNIPKYDQTYYHPTNHVVMIMAGIDWTASVTTASTVLFLQETTSPTTCGFFRQVAGVTSDLFTIVYGIAPASLGGQQRRITAQVSASGGTITARDGNPAGRGFLLLWDLGDASFVVTK
jgi:hypothetical protein